MHHPTGSDPQSAVNKQVYTDGEIVRWYVERETRIFPAEAAILARLEDQIRNKRLLDLGVGAGRTTGHLLTFSSDYLGVDYSGEMVGACRKKYPGIRFEQGDARDLEALGAGPFDFVFFSFNGLDSISHHDRPRVLEQVRRALKPGGMFLFSSHNLQTRPCKPWHPSEFSWSPRPKAIARNLFEGLRATLNYLRHARSQTEGSRYAVLIDAAHQYRLLNYYVDPSEQVYQLEKGGFVNIECFDREGMLHPPDGAGLTTAIHVHYLARVAAAPK